MKFIFLIYLALALLLYATQDSFIFYPAALSSQQRQAVQGESEFKLEVTDAVLKGWLIPAQEESDTKQVILYFGGNGEEVSYNIPYFRRAFHSSFLLVNYRGYGDSSGKPSENNMFADALRIYDEIANRLPDHNIVVIGRSVGSGVATYLASQRPCHKLALVTPFDSMQSVAQSQFPIFPMSILLKHKFRSDSYVKELSAPTLVIGASEDNIIPRKHTEKLISCFATPPQQVWIEGADHNSISMYRSYWQPLADFINN